ncbi:uncharacterized protein LOC135335578 [Halichondria panicea]|uniref:uncharacterized protein LOC135335578 n=1 Tax=Halichondria panicea TaxID=6063 RepID=UPI00312B783E
MLCSPVLCPSLTLTNGMISYSDPTLGRDTVATHTCVAGSALTTDLSTRTCGVTRRVGVWSGSPLVCAANLMSEVCPDVGIESTLQPVTEEQFQLRTTNREDGARLDVVAQSFWSNDRQSAFFDVRVFNPYAPTYRRSTMAQSYRRNEMEKKRAYEQRVREVEHGSFTPLVFSAAGGMGPAADIVYKKLASMLAEKQDKTYSTTLNWMRFSMVTCPPALADPTNGQVSIVTNTIGSTATYTCDTGYGVNGATTDTCGADGSWSAVPPTCDVVCPELSIDNGVISYIPTSPLFENTVATHTCDTGYEVITGDTTRTCGSTGVWGGTAPLCTVVTCPVLLDPTNGGVSTPNLNYLTIAAYSCDPGYVLTGSAARACLAAGQWSGEAPTCPPVDCGSLDAPSNGAVDTSSGTTFMMTATYTCNTGYNIAGSDTRTCEATALWTPDAPTCAPVDCGSLTVPINGQVSTSSGTTFMSTAIYTCNTGYTLNGVLTRTCQANGNWDLTVPTCDPIDCGSLDTPSNGAVDTSSGTTFMMTATYTCNTGYTLVGDTTRTCGADGEWSPIAPVCNPVDCMGLTNPIDGMITLTTTTFESIATYSCNTGLSLSGEATRTCQATGVWTGLAPTCVAPSITATVTSSGPPMAGQSYTLTCTVTGGEALNPTISYQWFEGSSTRVMLPTTSVDLTFDPLHLSDAGQYSCDVIVSSPSLTSDLTASSGVEDLIIQIPPPTVSVSQPPTVFLGTMFTLTCTAELAASVDVGVTVGVVWTGPGDFSISGDTTLSSQLMVASAAQSGDYTCTVTLDSASNLRTNSDPVTQVRPISVVGAPSSPVVTSVPLTDSIAFTWTQNDQSDVVVTYSIVFEYNGSCSVMVAPRSRSASFFTAFTPTVLFSFSNYRMTVTAVNPVGSNTTVVIVTTLPSAPSGPVLNLVASSFNSTSVTIQWDKVSCVQRNSDITGYQITYGYTVEGTTLDSASILGTDMREFTASGLIPRTQYTFLVTPLMISNSGMGTQVASVVRETSPAEELSLFLGGQFLTNHAVVTPSDIGDTNNALLCLTPFSDCCDSSNGLAGNWFDPSGSEVAGDGFGTPLYSDRGPSVVRLNRRADNVDSGVYRCELLTAVGVSMSLHVGLYPLGEGAPTIPDELVFNRADLTLTCVSNGGPASEVVWTRDGATVSTGYTLTQTVTNTATATYENVLTATTIADLVGTFICTVNNSRGTSNTVSFSFNGIDIEGVEGLVVGSNAALRCVSVSPATMIEWVNSGVEVTMTTTGLTLDLPFTPVTDTLHNSEFTCRVTRSPSNGGTGELSTYHTHCDW